MNITQVSDAAGIKHNEDLIATYLHHPGIVDILIFDGATSVSEKNYFDAVSGDAAWFVSTFASLLEKVAAPGLSQCDSVQLALAGLQCYLPAHVELNAIPPYAWPIAAMTWLRIVEDGPVPLVHLYALGDCKVLLQDPAGQVRDVDPYQNPQEDVLKAAIAQLKQQGIEDKVAVFAALLPMLRERRAFQNLHVEPAILCLQPQGPFKARVAMFELDRQSQLLAMTDGFYRLVDTYGLYSAQGLMRRCSEAGLACLLGELRQFERDQLLSGAQSVKKSDDASAVYCRYPDT